MREKVLRFLGMDSWDRPVYEDENGKLWKDVDPRKGRVAELCTSCNNEFDGEPDCPMKSEIVCKYVPERITW